MKIQLPRQEQTELVEALQAFFLDERSEDIGNLAALHLLDFFLAEAGPYIYNQGIRDAAHAVIQGAARLEEELDLLRIDRRDPAR